jgi:hypothetical protein
MLGFSEDEIAYFIAFVGIFSCIAQVKKNFDFIENNCRDFRQHYWLVYNDILVQKKQLWLDYFFKLFN